MSVLKPFICIILLASQVTAHAVRKPELRYQNRDAEVDAAIKQLWSAEESERARGLGALIKLGPIAISPLVDLLYDIVRHRHERYMTGKEEEGRKASEEYDRMSKNGDTKERRVALNELLKYEVTSRLKCDAIDLLVMLHAGEAVPPLVELMLHDLSVGGISRERFLPGARGLVRLGQSAVPKLIEVLESPEVVDVLPEQSALILNEEDRRRLTESGKRTVRLLVVTILGDIRDTRALQPLRRMLDASRDADLRQQLIEAISQIEKE